ncbi:MAG: hypothetical protein HZC36_09785 [Armatimonadetes bacterium]|nr:hypothetical protein [Armatimonadota bacterium]
MRLNLAARAARDVWVENHDPATSIKILDSVKLPDRSQGERTAQPFLSIVDVYAWAQVGPTGQVQEDVGASGP